MGIKELAARLGVGRSLAYALARRDQLPVPVIRVGTRVVVSRYAVEKLLGESVGSADPNHPSASGSNDG